MCRQAHQAHRHVPITVSKVVGAQGNADSCGGGWGHSLWFSVVVAFDSVQLLWGWIKMRQQQGNFDEDLVEGDGGHIQ